MNNHDGVFTHNMPQFGFYRINQDKKVMALKLGDPPNDKKRHDQMIDLTMLLNGSGPKNVIEIMQILKPGKDMVKYACGIFIVMNFDPRDMVNYVKNYQEVIPFERGVAKIQR